MIVASYRITVNHTNSVKFLLDYVLPSSDENLYSGYAVLFIKYSIQSTFRNFPYLFDDPTEL